jgi:hypothetical protein
LPFGSSGHMLQPSQAHLAASAPFRARHHVRYPAGYHGPRQEGGGVLTVSSRCLSAAGIRFSAILARLVFRPSHDRPTSTPARWTMTGFPRSAHTRYGRNGRPLCPGASGAHASRVQSPARRPPHLSGEGPLPRRCRHLSGAMPHETSIKGSHHSPARPSPHPWPPDDTGNPPVSPRAPHPHQQDRCTHARGGDRL